MENFDKEPRKNQELIEADYENYKPPKTISFRDLAMILMIFAMLFTAVNNWLDHEAMEMRVEEAYSLSALINLQEDNLLLMYGLFPEDVGLGDLRNAWVENPCYRTADTYSRALNDVIWELEGYGQYPIYDEFDGIMLYQV